MCVVVAGLWLLLLHAAAELDCVLYDVPHCEKKCPEKLLPKNVTWYYVLGRKSAHVLTLGKHIFIYAIIISRYIFWHRMRFDRCFFSNNLP